MSEIEKQDSNQEAVPFFARYLEGQTPEDEELSEEEMEAVAGGSQFVTKKYPSDQEDSSGGGGVVTMKYPSDNEDGSGGGGGVTMKYPSDSDEGCFK